ncbi:MAG: lytic transglycosylase domain-containing protein [Magnetococcales bacterium]|nr:lytic transglycosylase domain-containing protein [Magnetococcales bacterium]
MSLVRLPLALLVGSVLFFGGHLNTPVSADIYSYVSKDGTVHLTNSPNKKDRRYRRIIKEPRPSKAASLAKLSKKKSSSALNRGRVSRVYTGKELNRAIKVVAMRYGLDSSLVKAIIHVESRFNPNARSPAGAVGLMQLMPNTAKMYGVYNLTDPIANIHAGSRHFRMLLNRFKGDVRLSLAAYNAGEYAVKKYGNKVPPYPETRNYVVKVLKAYQQYRVLAARKSGTANRHS